MKIVNIILSSQNGGAEQVFIDYLMILKKLNHELLAITKEDAPYKDAVESLGVELKTITNHFGYHDFFAIKKIRKIIEEFKADAVIAHVGRSVVLVRKAIGDNKKIKLIAVNHSTNVKRSIGADIILSVNKEIFFKTIDKGQNAQASFVIDNAVDVEDAINDAPQIDLVQKNKITIGAMGRLEKCKGFHVLLMALAKLDKKFHLKIAGSGVEEKNLKEQVRVLGLQDRVEFCGWIKDKKNFFTSFDIFCMPSIDIANETFGLVLLEAMKYRTPIICCNADGPRDVVRDEIDGLIFDVRHDNEQKMAAEIVKKMQRLTQEKGLANRLIENSFLRLIERFSYPALEKKLSEIFGRIKK